MSWNFFQGCLVGALLDIPACFILMALPAPWFPFGVFVCSLTFPLLICASPYVRSKPLALVQWYIGMSGAASGKWDLGLGLLGTVAFGILTALFSTLLPLPRPASAAVESRAGLKEAVALNRRLLLALLVSLQPPDDTMDSFEHACPLL
jgi:hypothetical protein